MMETRVKQSFLVNTRAWNHLEKEILFHSPTYKGMLSGTLPSILKDKISQDEQIHKINVRLVHKNAAIKISLKSPDRGVDLTTVSVCTL